MPSTEEKLGLPPKWPFRGPRVRIFSRAEMEAAHALLALAAGPLIATGDMSGSKSQRKRPKLKANSSRKVSLPGRSAPDDEVCISAKPFPLSSAGSSGALKSFRMHNAENFSRLHFSPSDLTALATPTGGQHFTPPLSSLSSRTSSSDNKLLKTRHHPVFSMDRGYNQHGLPIYSPGQIDHLCPMVAAQGMVVPQQTIEHLQTKLQGLEHSLVIQQQDAAKYRNVLTEVTTLNERLYVYVERISDRLERLEEENTDLRERLDSNESRTSNTDPNDRRKQLTVKIPAGGNVGPMSAGLLTPSTMSGPSSGASSFPVPGIPKTPTIPGGSVRKSQNMLSKKAIHNLGSIMPSAAVQLPILPLTDHELIIFFFNSLVRPIVSLRLYSRGWGPCELTRVLNEHRDIKPDGYQRNTCSVKCTTAIRRGLEIHGTNWKETYTKFFAAADDAEATDAIRLSREEADDNQDCGTEDLVVNLIKFPDAEHAGIFTEVVRWCTATGHGMQLSQMHRVAIMLEDGQDPAGIFLADLSNGNAKDDDATSRAYNAMHMLHIRSSGGNEDAHDSNISSGSSSSETCETTDEQDELVESVEGGMLGDN